jgi:hypothetical protein
MRETIKQYSHGVYERATRDTIAETWAMLIIVQVAIILTGSFMFGVLTGASTALSSGEIGQQITELQSVETTVWADMGTTGNPVLRLVYGVFHWVTVLTVWFAVAGAQIGYTLPVTGHVLEYLDRPIIWGLGLLLGLQGIRAIELVFFESEGSKEDARA